MIILFGSEKGGVGKSTLATNFAVSAIQSGIKSLILVDADPQKTSLDWKQVRDEQENCEPIHSVALYGNVSKSLLEIGENYQLIIVDAAGRASKEFQSAAAVADVLVSPLRASFADLLTVNEVNGVIESAKILNPGLKAYFLLSMVETHYQNKEREQAAEGLAEYGYRLLETIIFARKVYRDAFRQGKGVLEIDSGNNKAANEIKSLIDEIVAIYQQDGAQ